MRQHGQERFNLPAKQAVACRLHALGIRRALRRGLGGGRGCIAVPGQFQRPLGGLLQCQLFFGFGGGRTGHHKNIFAAGLIGIMGLGLAQRRLPDLLVELGQLPAEGDAPVGPKAAVRSSSVVRSLWGAS